MGYRSLELLNHLHWALVPIIASAYRWYLHFQREKFLTELDLKRINDPNVFVVDYDQNPNSDLRLHETPIRCAHQTDSSSFLPTPGTGDRAPLRSVRR